MSPSERQQVHESARRIMRHLTDFWSELQESFDEIDREEARKERRHEDEYKQENRHESS